MPSNQSVISFQCYFGITINMKDRLPLYRIVSKFKPIRFGKRKVFLVKSQVPSPTTKVSEA